MIWFLIEWYGIEGKGRETAVLVGKPSETLLEALTRFAKIKGIRLENVNQFDGSGEISADYLEHHGRKSSDDPADIYIHHVDEFINEDK